MPGLPPQTGLQSQRRSDKGAARHLEASPLNATLRPLPYLTRLRAPVPDLRTPRCRSHPSPLSHPPWATAGSKKLNEALPLRLVFFYSCPRKVLPSSVAEGLEKSWMVKVFLGLLFSVPAIVVVVPVVVAEVITGKFWRLLAPVSGSLGSCSWPPLPLLERSIPRFWLEKMEMSGGGCLRAWQCRSSRLPPRCRCGWHRR
jgi:hypothetical protein